MENDIFETSETLETSETTEDTEITEDTETTEDGEVSADEVTSSQNTETVVYDDTALLSTLSVTNNYLYLIIVLFVCFLCIYAFRGLRNKIISMGV